MQHVVMNHIDTPQQQQHVIKLRKPENLGYTKAIHRRLTMQLEQLLNVASSLKENPLMVGG